MPSEIMILIGSLGAVQSFFLGIYILTFKKDINSSNLILGSLFLALAIRVGKSVLWAAWSGMPLWLINVGFAAHALAGPLVLLYIQYFDSEKEWKFLHLLHFVPAVAIIAGSGWLGLTDFWYQGGYTLLLYYQILYMLATGLYLNFIYRKNTHKEKLPGITWRFNLWLGVFVWGFAYFSNYNLGWTSYMLGPILYSFIIYVLSFYGFRNQKIFDKYSGNRKYKNLNLSQDELSQYKKRLIRLMEEERPYKNADFNLSRMSEITKIPSHILSFILNDEFKRNFTDLINSYRIDEAKEMLQNPAYTNHKIASIAYECGFNSISSFNTAFKKHSNMTPSDYRLREASEN